MPLKPALMRAIYACARENRISNEEIHEAIAAGWKKTSVKDLTDFQARQLLDGMRGFTGARDYQRRQAQHFHGKKDYDASADPVQLVSEADMKVLREAAQLRGWGEAGLEGFAERQTGKRQIQTMAEFNKVFWPLKAMNNRDGLYRRPERRRG